MVIKDCFLADYSRTPSLSGETALIKVQRDPDHTSSMAFPNAASLEDSSFLKRKEISPLWLGAERER